MANDNRQIRALLEQAHKPLAEAAGKIALMLASSRLNREQLDASIRQANEGLLMLSKLRDGVVPAKAIVSARAEALATQAARRKE